MTRRRRIAIEVGVVACVLACALFAGATASYPAAITGVEQKQDVPLPPAPAESPWVIRAYFVDSDTHALVTVQRYNVRAFATEGECVTYMHSDELASALAEVTQIVGAGHHADMDVAAKCERGD